jgi:anaphase-promoting complex subunit 2
MPSDLQEQFNEYANEYAKIKRGRKLAWLDHLGTVEIEIELEDREVTVEASPAQAAILYAFEDHGRMYFFLADLDRLSVDDICRLTSTSVASVKRCALFWVLHGVLKENGSDTFIVLERAEAASANQCLILFLLSDF